MKKLLTLLLSAVLLTGFTRLQAQDFGPAKPKPSEEKKEDGPFWSWSKVYWGGGFGLGFTQYETLVDLSPLVGYKITPKFSAGVGIVYNYYQNRFYTPSLTLNIYGGTLFTRFLITDFLFAHAEYQPLNGPWRHPDPHRFMIHNVWVGGGLRQAAGSNASFMLMALWNVNENQYSYPLSPQIRIGFMVGL